ncbi:hypothetical protein GCM10011371_33540 [Novosphingobium marinum]|uniref:Metal-responsive CopG/Arc/MetJ family transcriptional regulator n=1 Tax=Novosphingobium marinum TaxID=1514948 RepID=A0A7Y9XYQ8_9SPHN|nr:ribbon-helix-helix domain-containing protein [Novosphingobium marinum]NYH97077.1 metal-responsive CopG/Arc/MetJ family transcriptional regulator [Novosphingobium marinum]GGC43386.1 hypothetical protein GCM10011371_33540 [Novosphingobium marinum]
MKKPTSVGVKLTNVLLDEVDSLAASKGTSRSEIIRTALAIGLPQLKAGVSPDIGRILTIFEYTQLALSLIVDRQYPEDGDEIFDMAVRNVEAFHS